MADKNSVRLEWLGEGLRFRGRGTEPQSPAIELDGDSTAGPNPMSALLLACGGCTGIDAVLLLQKMRVLLAGCTVDVSGVRRPEEPRRYTSMKFLFRLAGEGLDEAKAHRAVRLSFEKYCSAIHSLAPDVDLSYEIEIA